MLYCSMIRMENTAMMGGGRLQLCHCNASCVYHHERLFFLGVYGSLIIKICGDKTFNKLHNSLMLFCRGVPVNNNRYLLPNKLKHNGNVACWTETHNDNDSDGCFAIVGVV
eukprot:170686_1